MIREKHLTAFPLQVRVAYLLMLLGGLWPPLVALHWIQFFGTIAMVAVDYCLLARSLSLLPWNRQEKFSFGLVASTIFLRPVKGNILQGLPTERRCSGVCEF